MSGWLPRVGSTDPTTVLRNIQRVLVVSKRTRWEFASTRFDLGGHELEDYLAKRGFPARRITEAHHQHHDSLDHITRALTRRGCDVRVVRAPALIASDLENIDCVFTAGGDGTVLETAARIKTSWLPVVSINTDPNMSFGHLCAFDLNTGESFESGVLDKLRNGQFKPLLRSRIQVVNKNSENASSQLALNEVFYAERDASRPTVHETFIPGVCPEGIVQRNSGVIVSTGTGSTAWMSSACMVHRADVARLAGVLNRLGLNDKAEWSEDQVDEITEAINSEQLFLPTSKRLKYCMRELVLNGWQGQHDMPLSKHPKHGWTDEITIRSLAWDGLLTFDGIDHKRVSYGDTLEISIAPETRSLLTIDLD